MGSRVHITGPSPALTMPPSLPTVLCGLINLDDPGIIGKSLKKGRWEQKGHSQPAKAEKITLVIYSSTKRRQGKKRSVGNLPILRESCYRFPANGFCVRL